MTRPLKVDHGVPVPRAHTRYPFGDMAVGDSFEIPPDMDVGRVRRAGYAYGHRNGQTYRVSAAHRRCWRVS